MMFNLYDFVCNRLDSPVDEQDSVIPLPKAAVYFLPMPNQVEEVDDSPPTTVEHYDHMSWSELRQLCRDRGVHHTRDNRQTLIRKLRVLDQVKALNAA
jgi:hypothetical protein